MGVRDGRPRFTALFVSLPSASFRDRVALGLRPHSRLRRECNERERW